MGGLGTSGLRIKEVEGRERRKKKGYSPVLAKCQKSPQETGPSRPVRGAEEKG